MRVDEVCSGGTQQARMGARFRVHARAFTHARAPFRAPKAVQDIAVFPHFLIVATIDHPILGALHALFMRKPQTSPLDSEQVTW